MTRIPSPELTPVLEDSQQELELRLSVAQARVAGDVARRRK